jgi:hypothetical protein
LPAVFLLGGGWVFPLSLGQHLDGRDFGLYPLITPTATEPAGPTVTHTAGPSPTPTEQPSVTPTSTVTPSPTATGTTGPSPTPTATSVGTWLDPRPVGCESTHSGDTMGHAAAVQSYGGCVSGLSGPEVVYALEVTHPLTFLSISLDTDADLMLLVLASAEPSSCLSWGGSIGLEDVQPGTYHVVVDGFESGAYEIEIRCFPPTGATPTVTVTYETPTVTSTRGTPSATSTGVSPTATTQTVTPTSVASATPTSTIPAGASRVYLPITRRRYPIEFLVNCGSDEEYRDSAGGLWAADQPYAPGNWGHVGSVVTFSTDQEVGNTADALLYQDQSFAYGSFSYQFDVPDGEYEVTLYFAELWWAASGKRVFDVSIEDDLVLDDYDVFEAAEGRLRARQEQRMATVNDGQLNITLSRGSADYPTINALRVRKT